jgi:hypothetical protein
LDQSVCYQVYDTKCLSHSHQLSFFCSCVKMFRRVSHATYHDLLTPKPIVRVTPSRPSASTQRQKTSENSTTCLQYSSSTLSRFVHDSRRMEQIMKKQAESRRREEAMDAKKRQRQVTGRPSTPPINHRVLEEKRKTKLRRRVEQRTKKGYVKNQDSYSKKSLSYQIANGRLNLWKKDPRFAAYYKWKHRVRDRYIVESHLLYFAKVKERSNPIMVHSSLPPIALCLPLSSEPPTVECCSSQEIQVVTID